MAKCAPARDLPGGWSDEQDGGTYRPRRRDDEALTVWLRKLDLDDVDLVRVYRTFNAGALTFKRESERHDGVPTTSLRDPTLCVSRRPVSRRADRRICRLPGHFSLVPLG